MKYFLFVGRLEELKGLKVLMNAWISMGNRAPKLIICGSGELEDSLQQCIATHSEVNVEYLGQVKHDELFVLLQNAYALIQPSQWFEGMPMTMLEAFSVGTPVVGSNIGNVYNMITTDGLGSVFQFDDSSALAETVQSLLVTQKLRDHILHVFNSKYSSKANIARLQQIYHSVIESY